MAATVSPVNERGKLDPPADQVDSDLDAEGEEETDLYQMDQQLQDAVHRAYNGEVAEENGDSSAEVETARADAQSDQDGGDNDETEPVGAVKLPDNEGSSEDEDADFETAADADPAFEANDREASDAESSESESEAEDWEAESNGREDADTDIRSRATCM